MLQCDKCSARIPDGSRFCPACADPVTAADRVKVRPVPPQSQVRLVCPKCEGQTSYDAPRVGAGGLVCPSCNTAFSTRVVEVRAKSSRGRKAENARNFSVRVRDAAGGEDLIQFENHSYQDFELRARDLAAFTSLNGRLRVVQNLTVGRYMTVSGVGEAALPFLLGLGAIAAVVLFFVALSNHSPSTYTASTVQPVAATVEPAPLPRDWATRWATRAQPLRRRPRATAAAGAMVRRGEEVHIPTFAAGRSGWVPVLGTSERDTVGYVRGSGLGLVAIDTTTISEQSPRRSTAATATLYTPPSYTAPSNGYTRGPRGGCYTYSASGRKRYVDRSLCN